MIISYCTRTLYSLRVLRKSAIKNYLSSCLVNCVLLGFYLIKLGVNSWICFAYEAQHALCMILCYFAAVLLLLNNKNVRPSACSVLDWFFTLGTSVILNLYFSETRLNFNYLNCTYLPNKPKIYGHQLSTEQHRKVSYKFVYT